MKRHLRPSIKTALKVAFIGAIAISAYIINVTAGEKVTEIYTVQPGDTIYSISEKFLSKNTAQRKYILQFQYEIIEDNPQVKSNHYIIHPGDEIAISYRVK